MDNGGSWCGILRIMAAVGGNSENKRGESWSETIWIMIGSRRRDLVDNGGYVGWGGFRSFHKEEVVH